MCLQHGRARQVGRNCDRGDAAKLPPEQLDLCEIEPLRLEEPGSNRRAGAWPEPRVRLDWMWIRVERVDQVRGQGAARFRHVRSEAFDPSPLRFGILSTVAH